VVDELFVDTSAWYPLVVRSHPDHERLSAALRANVGRRARIVTSNLVVAESHALIMRRAGIASGLRFVQLVRASPNVVVASNGQLEDAAVNDWLLRYTDQPFSMVDAVSFAIMAVRGTRAALTLDRHFAIAGYQMVTG
jgi:predicted nucleic acid-binding protein